MPEKLLWITQWFWFHIDSFPCIHLTLERTGLRRFLQHRIKSGRPKRREIIKFQETAIRFYYEEVKNREQQGHAGQTAKRVPIPDELLWNERMYTNAYVREYEAISYSKCKEKKFKRNPMWKLNNFSLVDENRYQKNFKYIPVLFTFSKGLRWASPIGLLQYGIKVAEHSFQEPMPNSP